MSSPAAVEYPVTERRRTRLEWCSRAIRGIERFAYGEVLDTPEGSEEARVGQELLRTTIGLRRKLDRMRGAEED